MACPWDDEVCFKNTEYGAKLVAQWNHFIKTKPELVAKIRTAKAEFDVTGSSYKRAAPETHAADSVNDKRRKLRVQFNKKLEASRDFTCDINEAADADPE